MLLAFLAYANVYVKYSLLLAGHRTLGLRHPYGVIIFGGLTTF